MSRREKLENGITAFSKVVSHDMAKKLRKNGFNEYCMCGYGDIGEVEHTQVNYRYWLSRNSELSKNEYTAPFAGEILLPDNYTLLKLDMGINSCFYVLLKADLYSVSTNKMHSALVAKIDGNLPYQDAKAESWIFLKKKKLF